MPFKDFTAGSVLTEGDLDNYLMKQTVMNFGNNSARSNQLPAPEDGMVTYVRNRDALEVWDGTQWVEYAPIKPWATFSPNWSTTSPGSSIGNGTQSGRRSLTGTTCDFQVEIQFGSSTNFGSGQFQVTLPSVAADGIVVPAAFRDSSASTVHAGIGVVQVHGGTSVRLWTAAGTAVNATTPFAWAQSDSVTLGGTFETG